MRALIAAALFLGACDVVVEIPPPTPVPIRLSHLPAFFDCLRETGQVAVSAHRGGPSPGYAENAIATFERTRDASWVLLEVDVTVTRDGALVLMHDDDVARTTDGSGAVGNMTLAEFQALRLQDETGATLDQHPPTLRQALDWAEGRAILELDIKRSVRFEDVVREVEAAGAMERVVFITYSVNAAARMAQLAPEAMIYTTISDARELDVLERRGVNLNYIVAWVGGGAPARSLIEALAARGVETRFGMFGAERDYSNAARIGAQIVAVDDPARAMRDLDAADGEEGYAALRCASAR